MTDSLAAKLTRLNQLHVRVNRLRDRAKIVYDNCMVWEEMQWDILMIPGEYSLYVEEMRLFDRLKTTMWCIQEDIDDLQTEILQEIYGPGVQAV